jgi:hypothetical protein
VIEFDEFRRMDLIGVFPGVVAFGVAYPLDQILRSFGPPPGPMGPDLFHLVFFFPVNQIRWRSGEVWTM